MIPFIVKGTVSVTPYEGDTYDVEDCRIVMANDTAEAYTKYCEYWRSKSEEYSIYYGVYCDVMETIL
jgi:predicted membrane-bound mannosyltransferase